LRSLTANWHGGSGGRNGQVHGPKELRHVCALLLIASGASDVQVANQMGHRRVETTKNIHGHLFSQDRAFLIKTLNDAVSRLYVEEEEAA
jgi:integrase